MQWPTWVVAIVFAWLIGASVAHSWHMALLGDRLELLSQQIARNAAK